MKLNMLICAGFLLAALYITPALAVEEDSVPPTEQAVTAQQPQQAEDSAPAPEQQETQTSKHQNMPGVAPPDDEDAAEAADAESADPDEPDVNRAKTMQVTPNRGDDDTEGKDE